MQLKCRLAYHRLNELGLLDPTERTELIAGQILCMAAIDLAIKDNAPQIRPHPPCFNAR